MPSITITWQKAEQPFRHRKRLRRKTPGCRPTRQSQIRKLARRFWLQRGCPIGSAITDWLRAEREVEKNV
jgi:hypothetical protein